jgi:serine phosphatase RsbU (regulator of sigma subunit)
MLVALLVGAIRTEAAHTSDPAALLEILNARIHGRMNSGFATCAALHITADGSAMLSNAANPAPYLNGEEISLAGALPLGMVAEMEYDNHCFTLQPGDILTFVSDGVIEATKSETGELFGFDRTRASSHLPALEIAQTAHTFGQTDDITVLTVTRLAEATA